MKKSILLSIILLLFLFAGAAMVSAQVITTVAGPARHLLGVSPGLGGQMNWYWYRDSNAKTQFITTTNTATCLGASGNPANYRITDMDIVSVNNVANIYTLAYDTSTGQACVDQYGANNLNAIFYVGQPSPTVLVGAVAPTDLRLFIEHRASPNLPYLFITNGINIYDLSNVVGGGAGTPYAIEFTGIGGSTCAGFWGLGPLPSGAITNWNAHPFAIGPFPPTPTFTVYDPITPGIGSLLVAELMAPSPANWGTGTVPCTGASIITPAPALTGGLAEAYQPRYSILVRTLDSSGNEMPRNAQDAILIDQTTLASSLFTGASASVSTLANIAPAGTASIADFANAFDPNFGGSPASGLCVPCNIRLANGVPLVSDIDADNLDECGSTSEESEGTHWLIADTDADICIDGLEVNLTTDPLNANETCAAINPNGTFAFTTNKKIEIRTFAPDIEIHNFKLKFQCLNGTFDTTTGSCGTCCEYDLDNGTCQAEIEKIWAMFPTVNVSMTLSTSSPINITALSLVCREFTSSLWPAGCSALSPHGFGANNWMTWTGSSISTVIPTNAGVVINLTGSNVYPNITIPLGTASINNTVQQIGCEVNGTWAIGDIQNFTINKTMTIIAN